MREIETETIQKIIGWLENVRTRPQVFFGELTPENIENSLYWFKMAFVNLEYNFQPQKSVIAERKLDKNALGFAWQLKERKMSDAEIIDELLEIEIESWKQFLVERIDKYRTLIEQVLSEYAAIPYSYGEVDQRLIFDREKDVYILYNLGWDGKKRVHHISIHVDIINGKFWIQCDNTEEGVVADLERAGVPKGDMVLAWHEPELRKYTEYAIG